MGYRHLSKNKTMKRTSMKRGMKRSRKHSRKHSIKHKGGMMDAQPLKPEVYIPESCKEKWINNSYNIISCLKELKDTILTPKQNAIDVYKLIMKDLRLCLKFMESFEYLLETKTNFGDRKKWYHLRVKGQPLDVFIARLHVKVPLNEYLNTRWTDALTAWKNEKDKLNKADTNNIEINTEIGKLPIAAAKLKDEKESFVEEYKRYVEAFTTLDGSLEALEKEFEGLKVLIEHKIQMYDTAMLTIEAEIIDNRIKSFKDNNLFNLNVGDKVYRVLERPDYPWDPIIFSPDPAVFMGVNDDKTIILAPWSRRAAWLQREWQERWGMNPNNAESPWGRVDPINVMTEAGFKEEKERQMWERVRVRKETEEKKKQEQEELDSKKRDRCSQMFVDNDAIFLTKLDEIRVIVATPYTEARLTRVTTILDYVRGEIDKCILKKVPVNSKIRKYNDICRLHRDWFNAAHKGASGPPRTRPGTSNPEPYKPKPSKPKPSKPPIVGICKEEESWYSDFKDTILAFELSLDTEWTDAKQITLESEIKSLRDKLAGCVLIIGGQGITGRILAFNELYDKLIIWIESGDGTLKDHRLKKIIPPDKFICRKTDGNCVPSFGDDAVSKEVCLRDCKRETDPSVPTLDIFYNGVHAPENLKEKAKLFRDIHDTYADKYPLRPGQSWINYTNPTRKDVGKILIRFVKERMWGDTIKEAGAAVATPEGSRLNSLIS